MKLIVDTNVFYAALARRQLSYALLFSKDLELATPDFVVDELDAYFDEILEKSGLDLHDFLKIRSRLLARVTIVPYAKYAPQKQNALTVSPDPDDWPFFALALRENAALWSNDKALQNQNRVRVFPTHELFALLDWPNAH